MTEPTMRAQYRCSLGRIAISRRSRSVGAGARAGDVMASGLAQHPVVTNHGRVARRRRLQAALADPVLEFLERLQLRNRAGSVLRRGLDDVDKTVVLEPQRKIAHAFGPR